MLSACVRLWVAVPNNKILDFFKLMLNFHLFVYDCNFIRQFCNPDFDSENITRSSAIIIHVYNNYVWLS
jgi:hypothetical protein